MNLLNTVLSDMHMNEEQLKSYILSKASHALGTSYMIAKFVEKGYLFYYCSLANRNYHYMIGLRNGVNILL